MENILITSYANLSSKVQMNSIRKSLKTMGIFGLCDIPLLSEKVKKFADAAKTFFQQPESQKQNVKGYTAEEEICQDHILDYKKEYYDYYYDDSDAFEQAYLNLADILLDVTEQVLEQLLPLLFKDAKSKIFRPIGSKFNFFPEDEKTDYTDKNNYEDHGPMVRVSHYRSDDQFFDSDHCNWRNTRFESGFLTASISAVYFDEQGEPIDQPKHTGLYVNPQSGGRYYMPVPHRLDVIYFQVGSLLQNTTQGQLSATKSMIRRPSVPKNIPYHERPKRRIDRFCMELYVNKISPILFE
jgi:hypothetical protein